MQPSTRYVLAALVGLAAAGVSYVLIRPGFEPGPVLLVSGLNAVVWTAAVGFYLPVYERFDGPPAGASDLGVAAAAKWGGIAGGTASLSVSGAAVVLMLQSPSLRYVAVGGGFVFGAVLLHMSIGMRLVATRVRGE